MARVVYDSCVHARAGNGAFLQRRALLFRSSSHCIHVRADDAGPPRRTVRVLQPAALLNSVVSHRPPPYPGECTAPVRAIVLSTWEVPLPWHVPTCLAGTNFTCADHGHTHRDQLVAWLEA